MYTLDSRFHGYVPYIISIIRNDVGVKLGARHGAGIIDLYFVSRRTPEGEEVDTIPQDWRAAVKHHIDGIVQGIELNEPKGTMKRIEEKLTIIATLLNARYGHYVRYDTGQIALLAQHIRRKIAEADQSLMELPVEPGSDGHAELSQLDIEQLSLIAAAAAEEFFKGDPS